MIHLNIRKFQNAVVRKWKQTESFVVVAYAAKSLKTLQIGLGEQNK
jgi:hypothetical protein